MIDIIMIDEYIEKNRFEQYPKIVRSVLKRDEELNISTILNRVNKAYTLKQLRELMHGYGYKKREFIWGIENLLKHITK
jgi:EAL domain-containing protein (putative c-di-GMP-specific phosphodiesterase class I)